MTANISLRRKLLMWVSIPVLAGGLLIGALAFSVSWHEIEEVYDAQLVHSAKVLLQLTEHELKQNGKVTINLGVENAELQHHYERNIGFRVWYRDQLATNSPNTAEFGAFQAPPGFSDQIIHGKPWRFFVFSSGNGLRIETSEKYAIRYELIRHLMASLLFPAAAFFPIILLAVWVGVRKGLKPVTRLSNAVDTRSSEDLTPVDPVSVPREILPLIQALNRLFARIAESFRREREFTDHAAHELRTPLAAMKTQTQVLLKKASGMKDCEEGLVNLNATIDRTTSLVEQLLSLARLQNEAMPLTDMDLSECVRDVVDEMIPAIKAKNQAFNTDISENVRMKGNESAFYIMLRNLLDNAIKYTPEGGRIDVRLQENGDIEIHDTGPGLSDTDKFRVFERFVRADKTGQTGSGLGLSIAQWIADAHKMKIELRDNKSCGLVVHIKRANHDPA